MLVVTEDSPHLDSVPYSKHIISSSPADIMEALRQVTSHYEKSHKECFGGSELTEVLRMLAASNTSLFKKIAQSGG